MQNLFLRKYLINSKNFIRAFGFSFSHFEVGSYYFILECKNIWEKISIKGNIFKSKNHIIEE